MSLYVLPISNFYLIIQSNKINNCLIICRIFIISLINDCLVSNTKWEGERKKLRERERERERAGNDIKRLKERKKRKKGREREWKKRQKEIEREKKERKRKDRATTHHFFWLKAFALALDTRHFLLVHIWLLPIYICKRMGELKG